MAQLLASNVGGYLNCSSGIWASNGSPLVNTKTQSFTGLAVFMTANTSRASTTTMAAEANLTLTVNETGVYTLHGVLFVNRDSGGGSGGGIKLDFGGGNATINSISWGGAGWINGAANSTKRAISATVAQTFTVVDNTTADWLELNGTIHINAAGTIIIRYAQNSSSARSTNIASNSFLMLTKVG